MDDGYSTPKGKAIFEPRRGDVAQELSLNPSEGGRTYGDHDRPLTGYTYPIYRSLFPRISELAGFVSREKDLPPCGSSTNNGDLPPPLSDGQPLKGTIPYGD